VLGILLKAVKQKVAKKDLLHSYRGRKRNAYDIVQVNADRLAVSAFRGLLAVLEGQVAPDLRARSAGLDFLDHPDRLEDRELAAYQASLVALDRKVSGCYLNSIITIIIIIIIIIRAYTL